MSPSAGKPGKHIIIAEVDNKPGVVSRISGLFTRRGYNIESFVTCSTRNRSVYYLTFSMIGTADELQLLLHQLERVMEVISLHSAESGECIVRELLFIKLRCSAERRAEVIKLVDFVRNANAADITVAGVGEQNIVLEASGDESSLDALPRIFADYEIIDVIRSGAVAVTID